MVLEYRYLSYYRSNICNLILSSTNPILFLDKSFFLNSSQPQTLVFSPLSLCCCLQYYHYSIQYPTSCVRQRDLISPKSFSNESGLLIFQHIATSVLMCHDSFIATVANLFPKLMLEIIAAMKCGDLETARIKQKRMNRIVDTVASFGNSFLSTLEINPITTIQKMFIHVGVHASYYLSLQVHCVYKQHFIL